MRSVRHNARRGFSLAEFLIALTISATLLAATMSAMDTSYKCYKATTESASINMSTRLAMHRLTTLMRNADDFGPFPENPIANPRIETTVIEFTANRDNDLGIVEVWSIALVPVDADEASRGLGPNRLDAEVTKYQGGIGGTVLADFDQTLMYRVNDARFLLDYDVGPRLKRATIDITVGAREDQVDKLTTGIDTPFIRMVSSVRPRRLALSQ